MTHPSSRRTRRPPSRFHARHVSSRIDALVEAGFGRTRAEEIVSREAELRSAAAFRQYETTGTVGALTTSVQLEGDAGLRAELGDVDFERYLAALGRPTYVAVAGVAAESAAANAGLIPGDEIRAYGGERVFNLRELNELAQRRSLGETVAVAVVRDGVAMQLYVTGGPLGLTPAELVEGQTRVLLPASLRACYRTEPAREIRMLDGLSPLLIVHVAAAVVAIVSGAIVFMLPKGTRRHRRIAVVYVAAMIVTTVVVAFVPASTLKFGDSGYGFFHLFIVVGLVSSAVGVLGLYKWRRTRERRWLRMHQMRFSFSYAGLLMAGLSQFATNPRFGIVTELTPTTFWTLFSLSNALILAIAIAMVRRYIVVGDPLRRYAMRPDA